VEDAVRPGVEEVIRQIKAQGLRPVMLTGDNDVVAGKVANQVGIEEFHSALLPEEKLNWLTLLKERYGNVIMAGDGINDSPALARADIGVAMGGAGNAQVLETADVVLLNDDLEKLPFAIRLSKFVNGLVRQNVVFSLGVKVLIAIVALLGLTPLWVAVLADIGISLLVTLNGMRALRFEPGSQISAA
jgi:Cd2+/Zn2+-exporting ATPase